MLFNVRGFSTARRLRGRRVAPSLKAADIGKHVRATTLSLPRTEGIVDLRE